MLYNKRDTYYTAMVETTSADSVPTELQVHPSAVASSCQPNATNELPKWLMTVLRICQITAWLMLIGGPVAMAFGGVLRDDLLKLHGHCFAKIFLFRRNRAQNIKIEPTTSDTPAKIDNERYPYEPTSFPLIGVPKRDLWRTS